ncbi:MAG: NADH-quinone oxidoreductase subunit NuoK [Siphonobacter sp.]
MPQVLPLSYFLLTAASLFSIGLAIVIVKRNAIVVLMGVELMLNAANLNLVAFSRFDERMTGQFFSLFVIIVAAAEVVVALSIILKVFHYFQSIHLDEINDLKN